MSLAVAVSLLLFPAAAGHPATPIVDAAKGVLAPVPILVAPRTDFVGTNGRPAAPALRAWARDARVPLPAGTIRVRTRGGCPWHLRDAGGNRRMSSAPCSIPPNGLYVPPGTPRTLFLHELGHIFDYQMPAATRDAFRRQFKLPRPWRTYGMGFGRLPASPRPLAHEQFADAYMACALDPRRPPNGTTDRGYRASPRRHRAVCDLIDRAGDALDATRPLTTFGRGG